MSKQIHISYICRKCGFDVGNQWVEGTEELGHIKSKAYQYPERVPVWWVTCYPCSDKRGHNKGGTK